MVHRPTRHFSGPALTRFWKRAATAFTLLEVMAASVVLVFAVTSSAAVLERGFQSLDTARNLTISAQIMENEMERLRLENWSQLQALQDSGNTTLAIDPSFGPAAAHFHCTRVIRDLKPDMKEITLTTTWNGVDGRLHIVDYFTRYGKNGLNDYYYTVH